MWKDPIVAEVRHIRLELEKECGGDFGKIYALAVEAQKGIVDRLVSKPSRPAQEGDADIELERA
jgi:hypothetical protein